MAPSVPFDTFWNTKLSMATLMCVEKDTFHGAIEKLGYTSANLLIRTTIK